MIKKFRAFFVCLICLYPFVNAFGAQKITLAECEKRSLEISPSVKFAQNEYKAAEATAEASETDLFPVLALEGKAYYVAAVPELDMNVHGIGQINKKLGDNLNYSAGFALRWNLFDGGVQKSKYEAAKKFAASKKAVFDYEKKKTLMETRIAYFNLISAASNLKFIDEQLELSASQNKDIKKSVQLGAKSKLDEIMSDNEVLIKQKQKNAAKILLIEAADKLNSLTGNAVADWVSLKTSRMPCHSGLDPESTLSLPSSTLKSNLDSRWNLSSSVLIEGREWQYRVFRGIKL